MLWQQLRHPFVIPFLGIDSETFPSFSCMVLPWMQHGTIIKHLADTGNLNVDTRVCFLLLVHHSENHSFLFKDIRSRTRSRVSPLTEHCSWRPSWCKWLDWQVGRLLNWLFIIIRPIFSSMKLGMPSLLILGWLSSSMQRQIHHIAVVPQDGWHRNLVILNHLIWDSLTERLPAMFTHLRVLA